MEMEKEVVERLLEWSQTGMSWHRFAYRREEDPFVRLCVTILL